MVAAAGIGLLTLIAFVAAGRRKKAPPTEAQQAERAVIFDTAINQVKDPEKLVALAKSFREEGLTAEAILLEQRAALATATPEEKAARTAIYKKALGSKNPVAIREVATAFDDIGATGCAVSLRLVAKGLEDAAATAPAVEVQATITGDSD